MKFLVSIVLFILFPLFNPVQAQEITVFPGFWGAQYYEDSNWISKQQAKTLILKNKEAGALWTKYQRNSTISTVSYVAFFGLAILNGSINESGDENTIISLGALATLGSGIGFGVSANKLRKNAILTYNRKFDISSIHFGQTNNGIGLALTF